MIQFTKMDSSGSDAQVSSLNSILQKLADNDKNERDYPTTLIKSPEFEIILRGTASELPKVKPLSLLILTKLYELIQRKSDKSSLDLLKKNTNKIILEWINSNEKQK